jgi:hypothetical protein
VSPLFFKVANAVMPPISRLLCAPAGHGRVGSVESRNKIRTIESVEFAQRFLGGDLPIKELVARIRSAERFRALWLAEGLGQYYGNRALARSEHPKDLLREGEGRDIPPELMLMVHAGLALSFARHHLDRLGKSPSAGQVRDATERIDALIQANALSGYAGIGYEAWGMVTRFFYRGVFHEVVEAMESLRPDLAPNLWHGAGRACYFFDFMPRWKEPWPVFGRIDREAKDRVSRLNLLAGLGSVTVIVNMRAPVVLETIVRERIARLGPEEITAYSQGIACSMVMRQDTTPDEENARALLRYVPANGMEGLWEKVVAGPARLALDTIHPLLQKQGRLDAITRFQPLEEIVNEDRT